MRETGTRGNWRTGNQARELCEGGGGKLLRREVGGSCCEKVGMCCELGRMREGTGRTTGHARHCSCCE